MIRDLIEFLFKTESPDFHQSRRFVVMMLIWISLGIWGAFHFIGEFINGWQHEEVVIFGRRSAGLPLIRKEASPLFFWWNMFLHLMAVGCMLAVSAVSGWLCFNRDRLR